MAESASKPVPDWKELAKGRSRIIGADECGYGSWAGPLVVCAVAVPPNWSPPRGLNDSKKLGKKKHEELFYLLRNIVPYVAEMAHPDEVDRGVVSALKRCYRTVVLALQERYPDALIVLDGEVTLPEVEHLNFPKADGLVPAVMAASVIGKFIHDQYMRKLAEKYPGYGLGENVGYGTPAHIAALEKLGPCPAHRQSYLPSPGAKTAKSAVGVAQAKDEGMALDNEDILLPE